MGKMMNELFTQYQADIDTDRIDKVLEKSIDKLGLSHEDREEVMTAIYSAVVEHEKQAFALGYSVALFVHDEAEEVFKKNTQEG